MRETLDPYNPPEMILNLGEMTRVAAWINAKTPDGKDDCVVCHGGPSQVQRSLAMLPGGTGPDGSDDYGYPSIVTICLNCGFTRYFNAVVAGVVMDPSKRAENG